MAASGCTQFREASVILPGLALEKGAESLTLAL